MTLNKVTPIEWRKCWTLHRAQLGQTRNGTPKRTYNMDTPDFVGVAKTESGVCWQIINGDSAVKELGEGYTSGATFALFNNAIEISPFDRCVFAGAIWEVRSVRQWNGHRMIALSEVRRG